MPRSWSARSPSIESFDAPSRSNREREEAERQGARERPHDDTHVRLRRDHETALPGCRPRKPARRAQVSLAAAAAEKAPPLDELPLLLARPRDGEGLPPPVGPRV